MSMTWASQLINRLTRAHPAELSQPTWFQEEARAERFVGLTRVVILTVWLIVTGAVSGSVPVIANLSNVGLGTLWWLWAVAYSAFLLRRRYNSSYKYLSTTVDMLMITLILFVYQFGMGYSTTLKAPAFMAYLVLGFMSAYRYNVALPLYSAALAMIGFGSLVIYFMVTGNIAFGLSLQSYTSPAVSPSVLIFQLAFIGGAGIIGAFYAHNTRQFVDRQVAFEIAIERERQLARTDSLTGLFNRRHFLDLGEHELASTRRYHRPLGLILFDIDLFKQMNDRWGHALGDDILKLVADVARAHLREADVLCRYGGEEFAVLLPDTGALQARVVAERIRTTLEAHDIQTGTDVIHATISLGISEIAPDDDLLALIHRADQAMYAAKRAGRNQTVVATGSEARA